VIALNIQLEINKLLQYGLEKHLIEPEDYYYTANQIIQLLHIKEFKKIEVKASFDFYQVMDQIIDYACEQGIVESNSVVYRDLFDSELMDCLMPRPSEIKEKFWEHYEDEPQKATDYYYELSQNSNYIRVDRTSKNIRWKTETDYGELDLTINLSKPEKDPKAIAAALSMPKTSYPQCLLCRENEGFSGHVNHPGRHSHRLVGLKLNEEPWFLQYSPYVYYKEHCIVLKSEHEPMKITPTTFKRLLDFVTIFPHYFVGSNADLPIVGGSILSHDHFQGGNYEFAMMKQGYKEKFSIKNFEEVEAGIVNWPMSVIRLRSPYKAKLIQLATHILSNWREYSDLSASILAYTDHTPHNTITPIARFVDGQYEFNLVLRNNRTTDEHPLGIFHPHAEHHHLKKENIGLIEVMGLAVLPARLKDEMEDLKPYLISGDKIDASLDLYKHQDWLESIRQKYEVIQAGQVDEIIQTEIGYKFEAILSHCGVFKDVSSFMKFVETL
jgi:UDPglucose--hexose-1-phosphate uridylyltransferase